nr:2'-5' RNA ligase family protein [Rhizobium sp. Root1220]
MCGHLVEVAAGYTPITVDVSGLRHLGAGVAFTIVSSELQEIYATLKRAFMPWLGGQDMQKWQPHITIQNKVSKLAADTLHAALMEKFRPHTVEIVGLDLWRYLGGPWQHKTSAMLRQASLTRVAAPWVRAARSSSLHTFEPSMNLVRKRKSLPREEMRQAFRK